MPESLESRRPKAKPARMAAGRLERVFPPIADLTLDPMNPRVYNLRPIRQIALSIETLGLNVPLLIDHNKRGVAGHGHILACRLLGWTEVLTSCPRAQRTETQKVARTARGRAD